MAYNFITEISQLRKMRNIERLSTTSKIKNYSLAEHSYFVGILFIKLAEQEGITLTSTDIETVLCHDYMETYTGDLIATAKNLNDDISKLWNAIEIFISREYNIEKYTDSGLKLSLGDGSKKYNLFKLCDLLDLYLFSLEEKELGNNAEGINRIYNILRGEILNICQENTFEKIPVLMNCFYIIEE